MASGPPVVAKLRRENLLLAAAIDPVVVETKIGIMEAEVAPLTAVTELEAITVSSEVRPSPAVAEAAPEPPRRANLRRVSRQRSAGDDQLGEESSSRQAVVRRQPSCPITSARPGDAVAAEDSSRQLRRQPSCPVTSSARPANSEGAENRFRRKPSCPATPTRPLTPVLLKVRKVSLAPSTTPDCSTKVAASSDVADVVAPASDSSKSALQSSKGSKAQLRVGSTNPARNNLGEKCSGSDSSNAAATPPPRGRSPCEPPLEPRAKQKSPPGNNSNSTRKAPSVMVSRSETDCASSAVVPKSGTGIPTGSASPIASDADAIAPAPGSPVGSSKGSAAQSRVPSVNSARRADPPSSGTGITIPPPERAPSVERPLAKPKRKSLPANKLAGTPPTKKPRSVAALALEADGCKDIAESTEDAAVVKKWQRHRVPREEDAPLPAHQNAVKPASECLPEPASEATVAVVQSARRPQQKPRAASSRPTKQHNAVVATTQESQPVQNSAADAVAPAVALVKSSNKSSNLRAPAKQKEAAPPASPKESCLASIDVVAVAPALEDRTDADQNCAKPKQQKAATVVQAVATQSARRSQPIRRASSVSSARNPAAAKSSSSESSNVINTPPARGRAPCETPLAPKPKPKQKPVPKSTQPIVSAAVPGGVPVAVNHPTSISVIAGTTSPECASTAVSSISQSGHADLAAVDRNVLATKWRPSLRLRD